MRLFSGKCRLDVFYRPLYYQVVAMAICIQALMDIGKTVFSATRPLSMAGWLANSFIAVNAPDRFALTTVPVGISKFV